MSKWFNPEWVSTTLDQDGEPVAIAMASSVGRGPGKTYGFSKWILERVTFKNGKIRDEGRKFALFCRRKNQVGRFAHGVLKSVIADNWSHVSIIEVSSPDSSYSDIYARITVGTHYDDDGNKEIETEDHHIGYVIALAASGTIKTQSSKFTDVDYVLFDEFIPDGNERYIPREVECFINVMGSISRGQGKSARFIKIFMASNTVQMWNPYFEAFGLIGKIHKNTKRYVGRGLAFEMASSERVIKEQESSPLAKAFGGLYSGDVWKDETNDAICKPDRWGPSLNMCGIHANRDIEILRYPNVKLFYIRAYAGGVSESNFFRGDKKSGLDFPHFKPTPIADKLRKALQNGEVRFESLGVQEAFLECL